ncbi:uncharacterized protein LOC141599289 [Silene latifolia]|uniref:uncharacterized protein LOC141599289 n=1 Tax=Silene latifolia TaxID=37657 RepID=UPI003D76DCAE
MEKKREERTRAVLVIMIISMIMLNVEAFDTNPVHDPCSDTKVQKWDGFTFGLAFSSKESFYTPDQIQLSPCDTRLQLANKAQLAMFRPNVDEISVLTINPTFKPEMSGGYMVAFAGRKYAARSLPIFVADQTHTVTAFTLVLEFQKGTLQNLYWKKFGCDSCNKETHVCTDKQECAVPTSKCKSNGGAVDCTISLQLTFSGTDRNEDVLNSWYEVKNMRHFSLYSLFARLQDSLITSLL